MKFLFSLSTLGVPLISGRHFDERDSPEGPRSLIISEAMARRYWPDRDPLGARLKLSDAPSNAPWFTVIGVVGDMRRFGFDASPELEMYFSFEQPPSNAPFLWPRHLVVRTEGDPLALTGAVRNAVWEVDPNQAVSWIRSMTEIFDAEPANRDTQRMLAGGFAVLALLLASVGLYGVLSYTVAQRTAEIGVRMALGAPRASVVRAVIRSALLLGVVGIGLGLAGAFGLTRFLASFVFEVSPTDPTTLAGVYSRDRHRLRELRSCTPRRPLDPVAVLCSE